MKRWLKRIMLLVPLSVLSATTASASASGWLHLGSDGKTTHYFYKPKTYRMKNNVASCWTKKEYNVDVKALTQKNVSPDDYTGSKSTVVFEEFNCVEKKKRTIIGKEYEGRDDRDVARTDWAAVQPGSIDEGLLTVLCKEKSNVKEENKMPTKK